MDKNEINKNTAKPKNALFLILEFIKQHYLCVCLVVFIVSLIVRLYFEIEYLATILDSIWVALFVSGIILKYIEREEKEIFKREIIKIQKDTAKDAIQSTFQRLIDKDTFEMIQKDVFQGTFVRKKVNWNYLIKKEDDNKMVLTRSIYYVLKNITQEKQEETFRINSDNTNVHCSLIEDKTKVSIKRNKEKKWVPLKAEKDEEGKTYRKVELEGQEELEVSMVMVEEFNRNYIYAVHSPRFGMVGLTLNVTFPKDYDFDIVVDTFSNRLEKIQIEIEGQCTYKTDKAIYNGQCIEFVCYNKNNNKADK